MSLRDFRSLTVKEFQAILNEYTDAMTEASKERWEQVRTLANISIQPHLKKRISPTDMLPFPWDHQPAEKISKEEAHERFKQLMQNGSSNKI